MKKPVGYYIAAAAGRADPDSAPTYQMDDREAQRAPGTLGLRAIRDDGGWWLAVANAHQGLQAIYRDTHWTGMSGTNGVWVQAMKRVPDAKPASRTCGSPTCRRGAGWCRWIRFWEARFDELHPPTTIAQSVSFPKWAMHNRRCFR